METNRFLAKRRERRPVVGFNLRFPSPEFVEFMGCAGFDYAFIDAEHFAFNPETMQSIVRAADVTGMAAVVRIPTNDPVLILGYLETGVLGIVVPHTRTAADAEAAVKAIKYYPLGDRGVSSYTRAARYGFPLSAVEYFQQANQETVVIALVEEEEGIENIDAILQVEGVDCLDLGPGDLAMSMGLPGQSGHLRVRELIEKAKAKILASDKALAAPVGSVEAAVEALAEGAEFIEFSTNSVLAAAARDFVDKVNQAALSRSS